MKYFNSIRKVSKKVWVFSCLCFVLILLFISCFTSYSFTQHTIMLTDNGFVPSVIIIHRGDTIVFKSKTGKQFWPASNHHPIHELNPEFDPKHPLDPDKEWSFTFNKQGIWEFHDHLNSATRGIITVD